MNKSKQISSVQGSIFDKTRDLINNLSDVDERIYWMQQLEKIEIKPTVYQQEDPNPIGEEIESMFNGFSGHDPINDFEKAWQILQGKYNDDRQFTIESSNGSSLNQLQDFRHFRIEKIRDDFPEEMGIMKFIELFNDDIFCYDYLLYARWGSNPIVCPNCGTSDPYQIYKRFKCRGCGRKFSAYKGTIFDNTKIPLKVWMLLIYMNSINKKNQSSVQIGKNIATTQSTSWKMQHRIRQALKQDETLKLCDIVEVDEAFCSKGNKWTRWGGISTRKEPIIGLIQRGGSVILKTIPNRNRATILEIVDKYVEKGSTLYTDGWASYKNLKNFNHDYVEHSTHEYVRGAVHTNNIENIWSMFKKNVRNAHHSISNKHMQLYLDEMAFKFNNRSISQMDRFNLILKKCVSL